MQQYQDLKKYYVNLDFRVDRKEKIESQVGTDFTRVSAVNGKELGFDKVKEMFDLERSKERYQFTISAGAMSCTLSHFKIYQEILADHTIADDDWVLISEDDNLFVPNFRERMDQVLAFLAQERFAALDLCILRYYEYSDFIDYSQAVVSYQSNYRYTSYLSAKQRKEIPTSTLRWLIKGNSKQQIFSFSYQGLENSYDPELVKGNCQSFLLPCLYTPFSSAFYLIKKRALRVIEQIDKPYWLTDDFASFVPRIKTFIASPCLAIDAPEAIVSDVSKDKIIESDNFCQATTNFDEDYSLLTHYLLKDFVNYYDPNPQVRAECAKKFAALDLDLSNYQLEEKLKQGSKARYLELLPQAKVARKKDLGSNKLVKIFKKIAFKLGCKV